MDLCVLCEQKAVYFPVTFSSSCLFKLQATEKCSMCCTEQSIESKNGLNIWSTGCIFFISLFIYYIFPFSGRLTATSSHAVGFGGRVNHAP